ncbi:MAG TPA: hypothetical protein PKG77_14130 [Phycisphaerae bacterium]|nr:hypothetical protein [Phycisphaerae bacterium]HQL73299.1 hypothetical protein [Phycisphaerae bacterium]
MPYFLLVLAILLGALHLPIGGGVTISQKTTRYTEPIQSDGTIDYVTALNRELSQGVTRENNAAVLLVLAAGPARVDEAALRELGLEGLPPRNAYFIPLEKPRRPAGSTRPALDDAMTPWTAHQQPRLAKWLADNRAALALAFQASLKTRYYFPLVCSRHPRRIVEATSATWSFGATLGQALLVRAMNRAGEGDIRAAWQDILAVHRLGRLVGQGKTIILLLHGLILDGLAVHGTARLIETGGVTAEMAREMLADLDALPPHVPMSVGLDLDRLIPLENVLLIDTYGVPNGGVPGSPVGPPLLTRSSLDRGQLLQHWNDLFDQAVAAMAAPTPRARLAALQAVADSQIKLAKETGLEILGWRLLGWAGRGPFTRGVWAFGAFYINATISAAEAAEKSSVELTLQRVCLALAAYRADQGEYPEKLQALVPRYLPSVPPDALAERPLGYFRENGGFAVYSVGEDRQDETHPQAGQKGKGDDVAVRVGPVRRPG